MSRKHVSKPVPAIPEPAKKYFSDPYEWDSFSTGGYDEHIFCAILRGRIMTVVEEDELRRLHLTVEDCLNGRYGEKEELRVNKLFRAWNERLGHPIFTVYEEPDFKPIPPAYPKQTILTRKDTVGAGSYDSISWALEVHVKTPDTGEYHAAILCGNDDSPDAIEFYRQPEPKITDRAAYVWFRKEYGICPSCGNGSLRSKCEVCHAAGYVKK